MSRHQMKEVEDQKQCHDIGIQCRDIGIKTQNIKTNVVTSTEECRDIINML